MLATVMTIPPAPGSAKQMQPMADRIFTTASVLIYCQHFYLFMPFLTCKMSVWKANVKQHPTQLLKGNNLEEIIKKLMKL